WQGGLAIYGGVAGGALAVWLMARHKGVSFTALADTVAPTLLIAQVLGRFGNWFNQELYGPELDAWWAWDVTCVTNGQTIGGRVFWAYVAIYSTGRAWIDAIRSEPVMMIGPFRIHTLVAILMALVGIAAFVLLTVRKQKREGEVVAADGSFTLPARTAGDGPDEGEHPGTTPPGGDGAAPAS